MNKFTKSINRLVCCSKNKNWFEDEDHIAIKCEVRFAISEKRPVFVEKSFRLRNNTAIFDLEWKGNGKSLADMTKDFYRIYGQLAYEEQYIKREAHKDYVTFWIIAGSCDKYFFGHLLRIDIVGSRIKKIMRHYHKATKGRVSQKPPAYQPKLIRRKS